MKVFTTGGSVGADNILVLSHGGQGSPTGEEPRGILMFKLPGFHQFVTCSMKIIPKTGTPPKGYSTRQPPRQKHPPGQTSPLGRHPPWADTPPGPTPPPPWQTPPPSGQTPPVQCMLGYIPLHSASWDTVKKWAVRIPLECILVTKSTFPFQ